MFVLAWYISDVLGKGLYIHFEIIEYFSASYSYLFILQIELSTNTKQYSL